MCFNVTGVSMAMALVFIYQESLFRVQKSPNLLYIPDVAIIRTQSSIYIITVAQSGEMGRDCCMHPSLVIISRLPISYARLSLSRLLLHFFGKYSYI